MILGNIGGASPSKAAVRRQQLDWRRRSLLTGTGVVAAMLQGATWLVMKTEGPLQRWSRRVARQCPWWVLGFVVAVSLWTPLASNDRRAPVQY